MSLNHVLIALLLLVLAGAFIYMTLVTEQQRVQSAAALGPNLQGDQ